MGEMHILKLREGEEYIKLGQALKATGLADERRGRKLYDGDEVVFDDNKISIQK